MSIHSLSAVVESSGIQFVGVAALNYKSLVDVDFYCKTDDKPELVHVASACDKKIPFSQKSIDSYVKKIIQYHGADFYGLYRKVIQETERKDALANIVKSVSTTSNFSVTPDSSKQFSNLKITLDFTDDFTNKALSQLFNNKRIFGYIDGSTLHLTCTVE